MVHDGCREQASSTDTESMSNAIRNANRRKKDSPGNAWSLLLAKLGNLNTLSNEKIAGKQKFIGELLMIFKGLKQKEQT